MERKPTSVLEKYIVVVDDNAEDLEKTVNEKIKEGWKPLGGISCSFSHRDFIDEIMIQRGSFAQAMIFERTHSDEDPRLAPGGYGLADVVEALTGKRPGERSKHRPLPWTRVTNDEWKIGDWEQEFETRFGENFVYWNELVAEIHVGDPDWTGLKRFIRQCIEKAKGA